MHARRLMTMTLAFLLLLPALLASRAAAHEETFEYDEAAPAAGYWLGMVRETDGDEIMGAILVERGDDGQSGVRMTCLLVGLLDAATTDVESDDSSLAFSFSVQGRTARANGTVSEDGQYLDGTIELEGEDDAVTFDMVRTPRPIDLPEPMAFNGDLQVPSMKLDVTLVYAETPGGNWVGHIDIPAQGLRGYPLVDVSRDGQTLTSTVAVQYPATITADLDDDERTLTGHFKQLAFNIPIEFQRDDDYAGSTLARPQHPDPPFPYLVREVTVEHPDDHTLAGTLTIPEGDGPFPAAVMITGSGPQDRDETIFEHRPFLVIADHLTRHGVAVLRCDDRGTAESTGDFGAATSADFATDVLAQVEYLTGVPEIDGEHIGLIGHSEGGLIAPMVANDSEDVAFVVLLAGPGVTGEEILRLQSRLILEAGGADTMTISTAVTQQAMFLQLVKDGESEEELREALAPLIKMQLAASGIEEAEAKETIDAQLAQLASPWMRYFVTYDPRPALETMAVPVLACNGTLDLQVWHEQNLDEIERVMKAAGRDVTIKRYEGLNHLFQPAETGTLSEYATIETTFDEQVLEDITAWIELKTRG